MALDFIQNGQGTGSVATRLLANNMDHNCLRPFVAPNGGSYINRLVGNTVQTVPTNNDAVLRKDEWEELDKQIKKAAKPPMRLVNDIRAAGLTYAIPGGMGKTVLSYEDQSDVSDAILSMDGLNEGDNDRPNYDLKTMPLPIAHKDFSMSARQLAASRQGGSPLDLSMGELAATKVSEQVEKLFIGSGGSFQFGGGNVYGATNFPQRLTKTMTDPTGAWSPSDTLDEVLDMISSANDDYHYGPFRLYHSPAWTKYMDNDFSTAYPGLTLRQRLSNIEDITGVSRLNFLTGTQMVLVQMTSDVVRGIIGMDIVTVQWESQGGMQINFKIMAIIVPQYRADQNDNTGIVHGSI
jgi:uncharacterized linocin/CFP29 family protein